MHLLWLPLLLSPAAPAAGPPPPATSGPAPASVRAPREDQAYADLLEEFEVAETRWRDALRAAGSTQERRELRKQEPATLFYPRFADLAAAGSGRAQLWLVEQVRKGVEGRSAQKAAVVAGLEALVPAHLGAEWATQIVDQVEKQRSLLGEDEARAWLARIGAVEQHPRPASEALLALARRLHKGDEAEQAQAAALWDRIAERFPGTPAAAQVELDRTAHLYEVGGTPPDFSTADVDGAEFKLSDYRGKVVLLDFWGFW